MIVQLLHKLSIRATTGGEKLLKVVKNPVTQYFPPGCIKIAMSTTGDLVDISTFLPSLLSSSTFTDSNATVSKSDLTEAIKNDKTRPLVFMFGSHAHGPAEVEWADRRISVSSYPLSAATAIARVLHTLESMWGII